MSIVQVVHYLDLCTNSHLYNLMFFRFLVDEPSSTNDAEDKNGGDSGAAQASQASTGDNEGSTKAGEYDLFGVSGDSL